MTSATPYRRLWLALATTSLWLGLQAGQAQAQVTYFERPPTPDELRRALLGQRPATAPAAVPASVQPAAADPDAAPVTRTRGIQWIGPEQKAGAVARPAALPAAAPGPALSSGIRETTVPTSPTSQYAGVPAGGLPGGKTTLVDTSGSPTADTGGGAALPITFRLGSSRVERDSMPYVEAVADVLRSDPRLSLVIEGHTDISGDGGRNLVLSWDRALGVMRTLVEDYGIDAARLKPVGKGATDPLPGRSAHDGANRRVQLRVASSG